MDKEMNTTAKGTMMQSLRQFSVDEIKAEILKSEDDFKNGRYVTPDNLLNVEKQVYLEPDDDLRRAITIEELREKIHKRIHCLFANQ